MKIEREVYKGTRYWTSGTCYWAYGYTSEGGHTFRVVGMGTTPRKAVLDLLFQQGRRRSTPLG